MTTARRPLPTCRLHWNYCRAPFSKINYNWIILFWLYSYVGLVWLECKQKNLTFISIIILMWKYAETYERNWLNKSCIVLIPRLQMSKLNFIFTLSILNHSPHLLFFQLSSFYLHIHCCILLRLIRKSLLSY